LTLRLNFPIDGAQLGAVPADNHLSLSNHGFEGFATDSASADFACSQSLHPKLFYHSLLFIVVEFDGGSMDQTAALLKIRSVADYQFVTGVGKTLFSENVEIVRSRGTGRIRYVYLDGKRLVTLRPTNGLLSLSIEGARRIVNDVKPLRMWVEVRQEAAPFIIKGRSVFAKHVVDADEEIRPREEVIVISEEKEVLAVGKAILTGREMKAFKRGVAVKVRKGVAEES
jgi:predicted RNA-binding protein (TIGR00451 family)